MKETREQKIGRKGLSYFGDSKRFFIAKRDISCSSPHWTQNGKGSELPIDALVALNPTLSHSEVQKYVIVCSCQLKKKKEWRHWCKTENTWAALTIRSST